MPAALKARSDAAVGWVDLEYEEKGARWIGMDPERTVAAADTEGWDIDPKI